MKTTTQETRTVTIRDDSDLDDYIEYLTSEAWPVIRILPSPDPGYVEVTFAVR